MKFNQPLYLARWTDRFICPLPIKLNPYRGCSHECSYCYMFKTRRIKGLRQDMVQPCELTQIEKIFSEVGDGVHHSYLHQCLERQIPIQIGTSCDPFQPAEKEFHRTYQTLQLLAEYGYTCMITTKGVISEEYYDLLGECNALVHTTITTDDPILAGKLEPNAPSPDKRLQSMQGLNDVGIETAHRLWPIMPNLNETPWSLFDRVADTGNGKVVASWLRLQKYGGFNKRLNESLGFDYLESLHGYPLVSEKDYWTPRYDYKVQILEEMKEYCNDLNMEFYTPNSPVMNGWKCCCGLEHDKAPWALKQHGYRIGEGITFENYIKEYDCPFEPQFRDKWESGFMSKVFNDIIYNKKDKTYSREKQTELI